MVGNFRFNVRNDSTNKEPSKTEVKSAMSVELAEYFSNTSSTVSRSHKKQGKSRSIDMEKDKIVQIDETLTENDSDENTEVIEYSSIWSKIYYDYILVDKTLSKLSIKESFLYNHDLKPVEEQRRRWAWYNFLWFWVADCFNINTFQIAATGLQLGLNWWQTWITVWIGYALIGILVALASRIGSMYHVSFPVAARSSFGIYFSIWSVLNRVVMATVWYAVQSWIALTPVSLMLQSIFGTNLPTRIHDGMGTPNATTYEFMCFFIFWVVSFPALLVPPHAIRHLFTVKAILVPFAAFGFLIWTLKKSNGEIAFGALSDVEVSDTERRWAYIRSIMACLGNFATLVVNAPDFTRFSTTKRSAFIVQVVSIPILFTITSLIGILVTAAGFTMYNVNYWSPVDVLGRFLQDSYSPGTRAGVFLISFVFALSQLGTNISANSLSAGTDMTALLPKFINIRRGSVICACLALCICPWNMMASSSKFTMALSAYAIFLSSIAGVASADYYVVRRGYIRITHLYSIKPGSFYMYNRFGFNWRALVAYLGSVSFSITGFVGEVGDNIKVSDAAMHLYYMNYIIGYAAAFIIYVTLCWFFPVAGSPVKNILREKGWYERWVEVEDFPEQWKAMMQKKDLYDEKEIEY
ncbi:uracil permease [Kluyveromyces lactis]|uniref:KLLA0D03454p n=1 Tax=Kluyveromyces lactis (strain ATCC 8585 / CBS 2359 / DSM 70799 / NBRC 1267 / NRRL Y-1140 / WM37) TaxID=284590 RepID=Q6CS69_KLULA|nr:uncharacterized protein KLLA0_D03454g [Kluyveromyces lactis]CAH00316.1 KLLA0D03454p [Kluyveromyces lactis]|eukprot:XP_453220.1 uncharacterized protein KLLA0_D03454g [Kluyveromyces lactis]